MLNQNKKLLHRKGNQQKKKATYYWENMIAHDISNKGLISKIYKELTQQIQII